MKHDTQKPATRQLGEYIKACREGQGISIRELAKRADIDAGGFTRIEHGMRVHSPRPAILNRIAHALDVPVTDLLTCVGYDTPDDLSTYLRSCYGHLPEEAIAAAIAYVERLVTEYDIDPVGPAEHEDETNSAQPRK